MASKILVVDDEPRWLRLASLYLESQHYQVATALSGEEALRKIAESAPDVVLADISMPGMDGYELCRRLRSDPRTQTIPFIFFTARDQDHDRVKAGKIGSDDYLTKPCPLQRVVQSIEAVMDRIERARAIPLERIGVSGRLEDIDLLDLVQTLELNQRTGALLLSHGERTGTLYFRDGVIVQADIRSPKREEPLFVLLGWKTGRFMFLSDAQPEQLPITASVANLLFQDLRTLEEHERKPQPDTTEAVPPLRLSPESLIGETVARLETIGGRLSTLHPLGHQPQIFRLLVAGVAQSGAGELLQSFVGDLSMARWAALGTEEAWTAYRTEIGRVRISPQLVLHLIAVRAEKRFRPVWEQCLASAHGVLLLLVPATPEALAHCQAFLKARDTLAPGVPVQALAAAGADSPLKHATGLSDETITVGSPDEEGVRLTALNRLLRQWLAAH